MWGDGPGSFLPTWGRAQAHSNPTLEEEAVLPSHGDPTAVVPTPTPSVSFTCEPSPAESESGFAPGVSPKVTQRSQTLDSFPSNKPELSPYPQPRGFLPGTFL